MARENIVGRENCGFVVIEQTPFSNVPADNHLSLVLCENDKGKFVTWIFNHNRQNFTEGYYGIASEVEGRLDLHDRFRRCE